MERKSRPLFHVPFVPRQSEDKRLRPPCPAPVNTGPMLLHRLSTIRDADMILYMEKGDILEVGTHDELMELHGKYETLYLSQFA